MQESDPHAHVTTVPSDSPGRTATGHAPSEICAAYRQRTMAEDTRRKILVGATILAKVQRGEWPESRMLDLLDKELTRPEDRALFGLPEKQPLQPEPSGIVGQFSTNDI